MTKFVGIIPIAIEKSKHIIGRILAALLLLLVAAGLILQIPAVQTGIAKRAVAGITEQLNADIEFSSIQIEPFNTVIISDFLLKDPAPETDRDTVAYANSVIAKFSLAGLVSGKNTYKIKNVRVADGVFSLVTYADKSSNLTKMFGKKEPHGPADIDLCVHKFEVSNVRVRMLSFIDTGAEYSGYGINWQDLDLVASLKGKEFEYDRGCIMASLLDLKADELSGYSFNHLEADVLIEDGLVEICGIDFTDNWSELKAPILSMRGSATSYIDFADNIELTLKLDKSHIDSRTLAAFAGASLKNLSTAFDIPSANAHGNVRDLHLDDFSFTESNGIAGKLSAGVSNLGVAGGEIGMEFDLASLSFSIPGMQNILNGLLGDKAPDLKSFASDRKYVLSAKGGGNMNHLTADINLDAGGSGLTANASLDGLKSGNAPHLNATIGTRDLDIGEILGTDAVGELSLNSSLRATLKNGNPQISIDTLSISRLNALDYDYSGIAAAGEFEEGAFNGKVICSDPNLHFIFQGLINLSPMAKNALYQFYINLGYADLNALNIDKRGASKASLAMNADYMRIQRGDLIGNVDLTGIYLENDDGAHNIGDISIVSHSSSSDSLYRVNLTSAFAEASYVSNRPFKELPDAVAGLSAGEALPSLLKKAPKGWKAGDEYNLDVNFFDSHDLLSFVLPGLYIAEGTTAGMNIDGNGILDLTLNSQRVAFEDKYLKNLDLVLSNRGGMLGGELSSDEISLASVMLKNNSLLIGASEDRIDANFSYGDAGSLSSNGELSFSGQLGRSEEGNLSVVMSTQPGHLFEGGTDWNITPATITFNDGNLKFDDLFIYGGEQSIIVNGGVSKTMADTLSLDLNSFNLGIVSQFMKGMDISGKATGYATLTSPVENDLGLLMNIVCDSTTFNGKSLGEICISSNWNEKAHGIDATLWNVLDDARNIDVRASYFPGAKELSAIATLEDFDLSYFDGLAPDVFSEMSGKVSGTFNLGGPVERLSVSSSGARLNGALVRVAFTNVPYYLNGPFQVNDYGISFNDVSIRDSKRGSGRVSGGITYDHLKDWKMDMRFAVDGVQAFDTRYSESVPIYGQLAATGNVRISGPMNNLLLSVDATAVQNGQLHIALGSTASQANNNLLTFKQVEKVADWIDPYEKFYSSLEKKQQSTGGNFNVRLNVNVTPETELILELDQEGTGTISCFGQGSTAIDIREGLFNINGDYTLNSGTCRLGLMNLALRDFSIADGSSIKFNGDIMDSDLDIDAVYTTKASLAGLIADTTSVATRRTVECTLNISDKLRNPQLGFAIDIPDIDPTTRAKVESALNTDDKVQKQFVALLVGNSFVPDEQYGIVNTSSILYSNVAGIMASQLSNILQRLNIPLDLGLKYEPNEGGTDIFDVAVSTELFNNRVLVNGNIGNRMYGSSSSGSDVVGDLDIEIKLDRQGAWRLTLFSHSADMYTNYLDDSQRNGIGMAYQKEFDKFKDFWKSLFRRKKESQEPAGAEEIERTTFSIE